MHPPADRPPAAVTPRRAVLRALCGLATAGGLTGCGAPWREVRLQPLDGDPPPEPLPPDADELVRQEVLGGAQALRRAVWGAREAGAGPEVAAVLAALEVALDEQVAALGPDPAAPVATAPPPAPADLPAALASASAAALRHLGAVTGPLARLVAAVAAGHLVAGAALAAAAGGPEPVLPDGAVAEQAVPTGSGRPFPQPGAEAARAVASALQVEAAARYGHGVLAVHLTDRALAEALADAEVHRRSVEHLTGVLVELGAEPEPPAGAYALPAPVADAAGATALAVVLEDGAADAWADLVAVSTPAGRAEAAGVLLARARRAGAWRRAAGRPAELRAMPGLSGRG